MVRAAFPRLLKSLVFLSVLLLVFAGATRETGRDWISLEGEYWRLTYPPEFDEDAKLVNTMMTRATKELSALFGETDPARLLGKTVVEVLTHPEGCHHASVSHASMESNLSRDGYRARIHLLAPSVFSRAFFPASIEENPYYRILLHEYSAVFVQRLILSKNGGWQYHEAEPWFLQGFDEFIACRGADGTRFAENLERRRDSIRRQPERVRFSNQIRVSDPYGDGMTVVAFLHDSFGPDAVRQIWLSPERSFNQAVAATLGTDYTALEGKWRQWLAN